MQFFKINNITQYIINLSEKHMLSNYLLKI